MGAVAVAFALLVVVAQVQRDGGGGISATPPGGSTASTAPGTPGGEGAGTGGQALGPQGDELWVVKRDPADPMALGRVDAPVVLTEWVDTRCPFCALFSRQTLPTLIEEYIDAGLVRYEVHTIEFFGEQSATAAVAVAAAGEQGLGIEYLRAMYAAASDRGHPDLPVQKLVGFAEQVGVPDMDRFRADLERDDLLIALRSRNSNAGSLGIGSVPFFLVGRSAIAGAQPIEVFRRVLDDALAAAQP